MDRPSSYHALVAYAGAAGETVELWRTAAGFLLAWLTGLILYQMVIGFLVALLGQTNAYSMMDEVSHLAGTPRAVLFRLLSFSVFAVGLAMAVTTLHDRAFRSLLGPSSVAMSDALRVVVWVGGVFLVMSLVAPYDGAARNPDLSTRIWVALLPLALIAIIVQASTEELVFRGYLLQQLAARFPGVPAWMGVPALLFGLAHWSPDTAGDNALLFLVWAFVFGVAAADLTARTGTIGAAIGFHVANNAFAVLAVSLPGPGAGLALYHLGITAADPGVAALMPVEFVTLFVAWLAARVAIRA
ncbi:MAG: CPBP family intramembrane glutamic endopeptidase [Pseudomonadota bacterium]